MTKLEEQIKLLKNFRDNPKPQSMLSDLAEIALEVIKELQEENRKLNQDKKEIFQELDKKLRLEELLSSDRCAKNGDKMHRIIQGAISLQLVLVRDKFEIFKKKYLGVENENN